MDIKPRLGGTPKVQPRALQRLQEAHSALTSTSQEPRDRYVSEPPVRAFVLDDFWKADEHTTHGELVEAELTRNHDTEGSDANLRVERKHVSLWTGPSNIKEGQAGALTAHVKRHFSTRLDRDADAFAEIIEQGGPRSVIQQSQGVSQSRVVEGLYGKARRDPEFRRALQDQLGLNPSRDFADSEKKSLLTSLLQETNRIHTEDPEVQSSIEELRLLQEAAHEKGHIHVISAGNQGALARELERLEVPVPEKFFVNEMAGPQSIIVGASDDGSKEASSQTAHRVASIASPNTGAHLGADGVDRPLTVDGKSGFHTGSSYAGPQRGSRVVEILRAQPDITRDQVLTQLQAESVPVEGGQDYLGAGVPLLPMQE